MSLWENQHWIAQMLGSLTPKQRDVMSLISEDLSPRQIAELLGQTPGAVRRHLLEARERLKRQIQAESGGRQEPGRASKLPAPIDHDQETNENSAGETGKGTVDALFREYFDLVYETVTAA
jgi:DNA-binding CsgD family transcriptional regulator